MPSGQLLNLLSNAKKSTNKLWSQQTINKYKLLANTLLTSQPHLVNDPTLTLLEAELNTQQLKLNFAALPLDYPHLPALVLEQIDIEEKEMAIPPPPFFKKGDNFEAFKTQVETYFLVQSTPQDKRINLFLYLLGEVSTKVSSYVKPAVAGKPTYDEIIAACKICLTKDTSTGAEAKFFKLQQSSESCVEFIKKINDLAKTAEITDQKIIINRAIAGLKDSRIRFELLKLKLTEFDSLLENANFLEEIVTVSQGTCDTEVNKVSSGKNHSKGKRFGKKSKGSKDQKQFDKRKVQCNYCKKFGHMKNECYKLKRKNNKNNTNEVTQKDKEADLSNTLGNLYF